ncbi:MAG TPA: DUF402 domain-containing protein [Longimicrobiales bacterium]|nr:DUF402 domain-containing protein [Longimicrobiales bacterium]
MTWLPRAGIARPVVIEGRTMLEADSPVVWFTFPGAHHDIGRFHTPEGVLTATYADILTPVEVEGDEWRTTDLFLDVLLEPGRAPVVLDADELEEAVAKGWLDPAMARLAEAEAARLVAAARAGSWPPPVVREWPLERARAAATRGHTSPGSGVSPATPRSQPED